MSNRRFNPKTNIVGVDVSIIFLIGIVVEKWRDYSQFDLMRTFIDEGETHLDGT